MVGAETAAVALLGVEAGHAQQRIDHLSVAARVRHATVLPEGFEVFGEDVLFGFPALGVGIVETVLQVGITARVVGLHDAVVEQFGDLLVHGIGYAVDHEQPSRTRFRSHVLAQLLTEYLHVLVVMAHQRPRAAESRFVVEVDAVVRVLVHRVPGVGPRVGGQPFGGHLAVHQEFVGHFVGEDREGHFRTLDLLDELLVGHLFGRQRMPLAPDRDDVHRIGGARQTGLVRGAHGRPGAVPAEGDLVLGVPFPVAQGGVIGVVAQDGRLLVGMLGDYALGFHPVRAAGEQRSQRKTAHCVFQEVFHGCLSL